LPNNIFLSLLETIVRIVIVCSLTAYYRVSGWILRRVEIFLLNLFQIIATVPVGSQGSLREGCARQQRASLKQKAGWGLLFQEASASWKTVKR